MKIFGFIIVILSGGLLLWGTQDFPRWGDPNSPASTHVSPRYLEKSIEETHVPNVVTAILADYRGYDTMFETTVIFCAGVACFLLLRAYKEGDADQYYRHIPTGVTLHIKGGKRLPVDSREFEEIDTHWTPRDLIILTVSRFLIPFLQLFALYVIAHGHYSPGGGFQGGVILGASIIVLAISFNLREALKRFSEKLHGIMSALGVFIYSAIGILCILLGELFLDYSALTKMFPLDRVLARSYGILGVEVGVGIAVMAVMIWIYNILSSEGKCDEGL